PLPLQIDDDHVLGLDESFVTDRRRAHDVAVGKTGADVPVGGSNIAFFVNEMAETRDLRAEFSFRHERHSIAANGFFDTRRKSRPPFRPLTITQTWGRGVFGAD